MHFKTGDKVVEPTIGICEIQGVRPMTVDGQTEDYYVFRAPNNSTVLVPKSQVERRGVRAPMSKEEAKKVLGELKKPVASSPDDARRQYNDYRKTLNSGDPKEISKLLRSLHTLDQDNELKGKEKEIMELAKKFLIDEISHVRDDSKTKVTDEIATALKDMYKKKMQDRRNAKKKANAA